VSGVRDYPTRRGDQAVSDYSACDLPYSEVVWGAWGRRDGTTCRGTFAEGRLVEGDRSPSGCTGVLVLLRCNLRFASRADFS